MFIDFVISKYNYWITVVLMMILFYVSMGVKIDDVDHKRTSASIPILYEEDMAHHGEHPHIDPDDYANPLPHVLMLTAIVVGVGTLGLALALIEKIYHTYGTTEEHELLAKLEQEN